MILRRRLFLSLRRSSPKVSDCSPANGESELGSDRRETGWFHPTVELGVLHQKHRNLSQRHRSPSQDFCPASGSVFADPARKPARRRKPETQGRPTKTKGKQILLVFSGHRCACVFCELCRGPVAPVAGRSLPSSSSFGAASLCCGGPAAVVVVVICVLTFFRFFSGNGVCAPAGRLWCL